MEEEKSSKTDRNESDEHPVKPDVSEVAKSAVHNIDQLASISDQLSAGLRKQLQLSRSSFEQIQRGITKHAEALSNLNKIYSRSFAEVAEDVAAQQAEMQSAFASLSRIPMEDFARQLETSNAQFAQALSSLSIDVARVFEDVDISALEKALQSELKERREDFEESAAEQAVSDFIVETYLGVYQRLPSGTVSKEAILMMILSVVLTVHQVESSSKDAHRIVEEFQEVRRVIQEEHPNVSGGDSVGNDSHLFVVTTELNLRTEPSTDAPKEITIGYNQEVEVVRREEEWAYVEFYDDVEEIPRLGWVHTEYLEPAD